MKSIAKTHQFMTFTTPPNLQWGAATGLRLGDDYFSTLAADMQRKRDRLGNALSDIGFGVLPVAADFYYYQGRADVAVRLDLLQSRYHRALGEQLVAEGDIAAGAVELRQAADLGEPDPLMWRELGDAETQLGHPGAARAAYARAREMGGP